jgi:hypothetical protein
MDDVDRIPEDDLQDTLDALQEIALGRLSGKRDPDRIDDTELRGVIRLAIQTAEGRRPTRQRMGRDVD